MTYLIALWYTQTLSVSLQYYTNHDLIVGIDRQNNPSQHAENYIDRPKCNCKKSRWLKLYCDWFSSGVGCKDCNCVNCENIVGNPKREEAIRTTRERNPNAFKPKILFKDQKQNQNDENPDGRHTKGCNCK